MASIPLPALDIRPPQDPTEQYGRLVSLRNMMQQGQLQQQLAPLQIQGAQEQNQMGALDVQQKQIQLNDQKLLMDIYAKHATGGSASSSSDGSSTPTGTPRQSPNVDLQSNIGSMIQDAINAGVSPQGIQSLLAAQKSQLDVANQAATLDKSKREARVAQNNAIWNGAETLRQIPEGSPERLQAYQNLLPNLQQQGVDTSKFPPTAPTNDQLDALEAPLGMINGAIELGTKKAQEAKSQQAVAPPGGGLSVDTQQQLAKDIAVNTNPQIQAGKVQVAREEGQARANIEAAMARGSNAALANVPPHLVQQATDQAAKAGTDYAQAKSVSDRLSAMMDAARKGNVVSYQLIPQEGALQVTTSQGVHRINMAEIQNYGGGSLWQQMQGHLGKALSGKSIPDSVLDDMAQMQKIQSEGAQSKYENTLKTINQNYGSSFQPVQMSDMKNVPPQNATPKVTVGQRVTIKGKSLLVTRVYPDGSFDTK